MARVVITGHMNKGFRFSFVLGLGVWVFSFSFSGYVGVRGWGLRLRI